MTLPYCYQISPTVQGQYLIGTPAVLLYKSNILWVSQQSCCIRTVHYGCLISVSRQTYCTRAVPCEYPSGPTVQGQYPVGIPAALWYKSSTLWVTQQSHCTKAVPCGYPSSPIVQEQYLMGIPAALLYRYGTLCVTKQTNKTKTVPY